MRAAEPSRVINVRFTLERGRIRGVVMAVAFGPARATLVRTRDGVFERAGRRRCWRRLGSPHPVPHGKLISLRGSRFFAPEPIGSLTRLEVIERDPATGERNRFAYKIAR